ncbi:type I methionyl aminopeptidase [Patescibacteria group bacterium]|nr:type I methionyl aminopeptidase [Patescibacteria group bacterium]
MISIKTSEEIKIMREGGQKLAHIMEKLQKQVRPGVNTEELDAFAEHEIIKAGAKPAFKGYQKFPRTLCTSVNEEVVHAIPSKEKVLREGDILTLDIGLIWSASLKNRLDSEAKRTASQGGNGFYLDMARTVSVGEVSFELKHLIETTKKALRLGIKKARTGNTFGDIGNTIQRFVESQGYNVVRDLCGHGIGVQLHEDPQVPNYGKRKTGPEIKEGMVFCIEPMVTVGGWKLKKSADNYGFSTEDGSLSAHFEDTVAVTAKGTEVLTKLK